MLLQLAPNEARGLSNLELDSVLVETVSIFLNLHGLLNFSL